MITMKEYRLAQRRAAEECKKASIDLTESEIEHIEVVDEGLGELEVTGLQIITYINTERICAKELIMFPNQTCPEHRHPTIDGVLGKEETFRCRKGKVYLYVEEKDAPEKAVTRAVEPPKGSEQYYTCTKEIILLPGEQYTIYPDTFHWFKAGEEGAIVSEFSTRSNDLTDEFTDPRIKRITEIGE